MALLGPPLTRRRRDSRVGKPRLDHLQDAVQGILDRGVPGDLIETGVLRGGASLLMKAVLRVRARWCGARPQAPLHLLTTPGPRFQSNGARGRRVFLCDTFAPAPGEPPFAVRFLVLPIVRCVPHPLAPLV